MLELIGNTPIIKLDNLSTHHNIFAKCEWLNPTGSIKDRVAKYIIEKAIQDGDIKPNQPIVEASSGNMGTSIAAIAQKYSNPVYITVPEKTGMMKRKMIESYGANLIVCKSTTDTDNAEFYVNKAKAIAKEKNAFLVNQYDNLKNTECHYETTGTEIVEYFIKNNLDLGYLITVGGSGGTVSGCSKKIKEYFKNSKTIMPDPKGSVYYDLYYNKKVIKENVFSYKVEGPGNPKFCQSMNFEYIDKISQFDDNQAIQGCLDLAKEQGIYAGHSSGANYHIMKELLKSIEEDKESKNILILILDTGLKYNF